MGIGRIKSRDTISYEILRKIKHLASKPKIKNVTLEAHTDIINNLLNNEEESFNLLQEDLGLKIKLVINNENLDKFSLKNN